MNYQEFESYMQKTADIGYSAAVLGWDKEVYMPKGSMAFRARQVATLSGLAHERMIDKKFGNALKALRDSNILAADQLRNVELTIEDFEKEQKLPIAFVEKLSQTTSEAYQAWVNARNENDFKVFAPHLDKLRKLKRQESELRGYVDKPYDALLDLYEKECTSVFLEKTFEEARNELIPLIRDIRNQPQADTAFLSRKFDKERQWEFGVELLKGMGYDFNYGRQDISPHPFTISFSPQDVRVTTRVDEMDFSNMTWSCIHEGGHALYEQGLPTNQYGLPLGTAVSLGIHESQSRLWENHVGRGKSYWKYWFPKLKKSFTAELADVSEDHFYKAINQIAPNQIRTEADELHYHLHVIIRFEIEKALINDNLPVSELREFWNEKYVEYMDVKVPNDNQGILQDIHWSHGSFGYFPTYSLGSFYAAQFYKQAAVDIPNLETDLEKGDSTPLLTWLREHIHQHGRKYDPDQLCEKITGEKLNVAHFMDYARGKFLL